MNSNEALKKMQDGNKAYIMAETGNGDISPAKRIETYNNGQKPYAVIVACSDSRVIPENIFSAGIGELFVIRVAGNVIDRHQLGSIEYAIEHLNVSLVVVLGHTHCGAVDAAMHHDPDGHIKYIIDDILEAIGDEKDEKTACILNVKNACKKIEECLDIQKLEKEKGLKILGALYKTDTGEVDFSI